MAKKRKRKQRGAPPGTLEFTGERKVENPLVLRVQFNETNLETRHLAKDEVPGLAEGGVVWYDIRGLHDVQLIEHFGKHFKIHPLVLEDILNTQQRPKFEEYGEHIFMIVSELTFKPATLELTEEQIAIYFGKNFMLTFQEIEDDTFATLREHLKAGRGRILSKNADYLAYSLVDYVADNYFDVLDQIEEVMQALEDEISQRARGVKEKIHRLKFEMLTLRKAVVPMREAVGKFSRSDCPCVSQDTQFFVRDLYDHVLRITDLTETYRDMLNGLVELYHSELSLRMNQIIQVLTIITTIFVPLTFLAGVYGMNFEYMPELKWKYGYLMAWVVFVAVGISLVIYFKRKRWI